MSASRLYPERPFLAASAALIRDGRLLLATRGKPPLAGIFSLPGGLVETGETLAEAALRELREEVGVTGEVVDVIGPVEFLERDGEGRVSHHFVILAHLVRWVAGEPCTGEEASELRWIGPDEIGTVPTTPGLDPILLRAFVLSSAACPTGR